MLPSDTVSYHKVVLDRLVFAAQTAVSKNLIEDLASPLQTQWVESHIRDAMVFQIRTGIAAQHLDRAVVRYPATWREAMRAAFYAWCARGHWPWFGDYGPKRWPVCEHVVTIDVKALYPKIAMPSQRHTVMVLREEGDG